jgi:cephalosporin hydroxylase
MHIGVQSRTLKGLRRVAALWSAASELDRIAATHTGYVANKWKHYFEIYDRHFSRFRGRDISLLEIGVAGGGSLQLWRRYFGPRARIVGLDINPDCKRFESPDMQVLIGNQGDPAFLAQLAAQHGPFDIVIDDGSHTFEHQLTSFRALFPHISKDGIYACEDLWTSYAEKEYGGGPKKVGTFAAFLKEQVDELNAWYWRDDLDTDPVAFAKTVHGIHFYPALAIIEKRTMQRPILTPVGRRRSE